MAYALIMMYTVNTFLTLYCLNWFIFCCGVIQCFCLKSFMGLNRKLKTLPEILDQTTEFTAAKGKEGLHASCHG